MTFVRYTHADGWNIKQIRSLSQPLPMTKSSRRVIEASARLAFLSRVPSPLIASARLVVCILLRDFQFNWLLTIPSPGQPRKSKSVWSSGTLDRISTPVPFYHLSSTKTNGYVNYALIDCSVSAVYRCTGRDRYFFPRRCSTIASILNSHCCFKGGRRIPFIIIK